MTLGKIGATWDGEAIGPDKIAANYAIDQERFKLP